MLTLAENGAAGWVSANLPNGLRVSESLSTSPFSDRQINDPRQPSALKDRLTYPLLTIGAMCQMAH